MGTLDNHENLERLHRWQRARLDAYGDGVPFSKKGPDGITVLTYFFRPAETAETLFPFTKCAIYETWRHFGSMKAVVVTHAPTRPVLEFANRFPGLVEVQVEPTLRPVPPRDVESMSVDCISRLHERFSTPEVLIVQDDGFPLRPGIEEFSGKWDWIGAPFTGDDDWITRRLLKTSNLVGNGGFCLRSRAICEAASKLWKAGWKHLPSCYLIQEDIFYIRLLPRWSRSYAKRFRIAPLEAASRFSLELTQAPGFLPLGFHSAAAFRKLEGMIP